MKGNETTEKHQVLIMSITFGTDVTHQQLCSKHSYELSQINQMQNFNCRAGQTWEKRWEYEMREGHGTATYFPTSPAPTPDDKGSVIG